MNGKCETDVFKTVRIYKVHATVQFSLLMAAKRTYTQTMEARIQLHLKFRIL
jgi:hypothetical protein